MTLLKRSLVDEIDETHDRAAIEVNILTKAMEKNPYISRPDDDANPEDPDVPDIPGTDDTAAYLFLDSLPMSFEKLERSVKAYIKKKSFEVSLSSLHVVFVD